MCVRKYSNANHLFLCPKTIRRAKNPIAGFDGPKPKAVRPGQARDSHETPDYHGQRTVLSSECVQVFGCGGNKFFCGTLLANVLTFVGNGVTTDWTK